MANYKTVILSGAEKRMAVAGANCDIRNDSADTVYASAAAGITADADGVMSVPAGASAKLLDISGSVYLLGTGKVHICGNDHSEAVFKSAPSGGGGSSEVSKSYVDNGDDTAYALAVQYISENISNANLLRNPDFTIDQRGITGTVSEAGAYVADCWRLVSGTATRSADGIVLDGVIAQTVKTDNVVLTAYSDNGIASYDRDSEQFMITAHGETITRCKLEYGDIATAYRTPVYQAELAECQRYFCYLATYVCTRAAVVTTDFIDFTLPVTMAAVPEIVGELYVGTVQSGTLQEGFTFKAIKTTPSGTLIRATKTAHGLTDACFGASAGAGLQCTI